MKKHVNKLVTFILLIILFTTLNNVFAYDSVYKAWYEPSKDGDYLNFMALSVSNLIEDSAKRFLACYDLQESCPAGSIKGNNGIIYNWGGLVASVHRYQNTYPRVRMYEGFNTIFTTERMSEYEEALLTNSEAYGAYKVKTQKETAENINNISEIEGEPSAFKLKAKENFEKLRYRIDIKDDNLNKIEASNENELSGIIASKINNTTYWAKVVEIEPKSEKDKTQYLYYSTLAISDKDDADLLNKLHEESNKSTEGKIYMSIQNYSFAHTLNQAYGKDAAQEYYKIKADKKNGEEADNDEDKFRWYFPTAYAFSKSYGNAEPKIGWSSSTLGWTWDGKGSIFNYYDNEVVVPLNNTKTVLVKHVDIGTGLTFDEQVTNGTILLDKDKSNRIMLYENHEYSYILENQLKEVSINILKPTSNDYWSLLGYNIAFGKVYGEAVASLNNLKASEQPYQYTEKETLNITSTEDYVILEVYYAKKDREVFVNHYVIDEAFNPRGTLTGNQMAILSDGTIKNNLVYGVESNFQEYYKIAQKDFITVSKSPVATSDKYEYVGYYIDTADTYLDGSVTDGGEKATVSGSNDQIYIKFMYKGKDGPPDHIEIEKPQPGKTPARDVLGRLKLKSISGIDTVCNDGTMEVYSVPNMSQEDDDDDVKAYVDELYPYLLGGLNLKRVEAEDDMKVSVTISSLIGAGSDSVKNYSISYKPVYYRLQDVLIYKTNTLDIYNTGSYRYDTKGDILFNTTTAQESITPNGSWSFTSATDGIKQYTDLSDEEYKELYHSKISSSASTSDILQNLWSRYDKTVLASPSVGHEKFEADYMDAWDYSSVTLTLKGATTIQKIQWGTSNFDDFEDEISISRTYSNTDFYSTVSRQMKLKYTIENETDGIFDKVDYDGNDQITLADKKSIESDITSLILSWESIIDSYAKEAKKLEGEVKELSNLSPDYHEKTCKTECGEKDECTGCKEYNDDEYYYFNWKNSTYKYSTKSDAQSKINSLHSTAKSNLATARSNHADAVSSMTSEFNVLYKKYEYILKYYDVADRIENAVNSLKGEGNAEIADIANVEVNVKYSNVGATFDSVELVTENEVTKTISIEKEGSTVVNVVDGEKFNNNTHIILETERPNPDKSWYENGFGENYLSVQEFLPGNLKINRSRLNGIRYIAGLLTLTKDDTNSIGENPFVDNYYNDDEITGNLDVKKKRTVKTKYYDVNTNNITKNYGYSLGNVEPINVYQPLAVKAEFWSEDFETLINHSNKRKEELAGVIQQNSSFTITFSNPTTDRFNKKALQESLDYTKRYNLVYFIKFTFDVAEATYNGETHSGILSANTWIGPIKTSEPTFKARAYITTSGSSLTDTAARYSYSVRAYSFNSLSLSSRLTNTFVNYQSIEDLAKDVDEVSNPCGVGYVSESKDGGNNNSETDEYDLELINRIYDFRVTDLVDINWKSIFRTNNESNINSHTGNVYYSGNKKLTINYETLYNKIENRTTSEIGTNPVKILPLGPYKNTDTTYVYSPKLGYRFSFDFKVTGSYDSSSYATVKPRFYYISKNGKTYIDENGNNYVNGAKVNGKTDRIVLMYKNAAGNYVNISTGSNAIYMQPDDGYRLLNTFGTKHLSTANISLGNYKEIVLKADGNSTSAGNQGLQTFYGEYKLPASTIVTLNGNIKNTLKDGYIGVVFDISYTYDNDTTIYYGENDKNDEDHKPNTSQWDYEGYLGANAGNAFNSTLRLEKGVWTINNDLYQLIKGTVILYDASSSASVDFD